MYSAVITAKYSGKGQTRVIHIENHSFSRGDSAWIIRWRHGQTSDWYERKVEAHAYIAGPTEPNARYVVEALDNNGTWRTIPIAYGE